MQLTYTNIVTTFLHNNLFEEVCFRCPRRVAGTRSGFGFIFCVVYWWFAISPLRFIRQSYGGHVGRNHAPNTIAANDILLLAFLQHGRHDVKCKPSDTKLLSLPGLQQYFNIIIYNRSKIYCTIQRTLQNTTFFSFEDFIGYRKYII
jgi:hypothetical protein